MLLTISTTHQPATDLGYLLYKHPERAQSFDVASGKVHVFYPEASEERCTAAMLLEVDPVRLVRGNEGAHGEGWTLRQYVNDRPYVASSFVSVALGVVFRSAMAGQCKERPELATKAIDLRVELSAVPCPGDGAMIARLFEPLGYQVEATRLPLDPAFPAWGGSPCFAVTLTATMPLSQMLGHLYVLLPVLDGEKHYWVGDAEVDKLLRYGQGWLEPHPERELIARRYLKFRGLTKDALKALREDDDAPADDARIDDATVSESTEPHVTLQSRRMDAVASAIVASGATRVLDLGCGEGQLMERLRDYAQFEKFVGVDVSYRELERAARRLRLEGWPDVQDQRVVLMQGSLLYRDRRLAEFDAAALVEVIEHLDPPRLATLEEMVFRHMRPRTLVVTTPNREYNSVWESLPAGGRRHDDHRFEWTREQFQGWGDGLAERFGYEVRYRGIGDEVEGVGAPTQMGVFTRGEEVGRG
ncbi:3' terminal RNA ribose 2'-O-methyltransferase Hen1 [Lujinxingia vulgaris]|uniref:Small RNA 2'-O-methyltransferase n=1 Tax=Lujinxingia vulgaris TaxID=2600176 RepID=A0A5C6XDU0_9DELT|nr:3' terminal RNA ribose 2'-O-methyltransferase Hen1 [Lujinxingia vulgaris]TXD41264.1 3' terminal RNA ribose 2'-O-methyltransferase Hen1 [Lujinxingia vulgaris]